ncbi:hypothetical protein [Caulobacter segnis]|uniref:Uncharacterized protein n=1 Tax=Caulobacter segnis TaxID=88688 RepID=A0A2W5WP47_9CAUL|nr:hypothetical protein [Caulobacter segnis]PZR35788.1 MAG: hypothetical protein DI526_05735 [Caulobacter segnis]
MTLAQKIAAERSKRAELAERFAEAHGKESVVGRNLLEEAAHYWAAADAARQGDLTPRPWVPRAQISN